MSDQRTSTGTFRKLWPQEQSLFRDHLLRLDRKSRYLRFAHGVSDAFVDDYASHMAELGTTVFAYIEDGEVRGAAELKKLGNTWGREAEAAFSVEPAYQEQGIGSELMGRVIRAARNRGVHLLYLSCMAENAIVPEEPNYFSLLAEAVEDRVGFMMAVLDLQRRVVKAA
jgi:GNAT superfamily N-acetyltransferase